MGDSGSTRMIRPQFALYAKQTLEGEVVCPAHSGPENECGQDKKSIIIHTRIECWHLSMCGKSLIPIHILKSTQ